MPNNWMQEGGMGCGLQITELLAILDKLNENEH